MVRFVPPDDEGRGRDRFGSWSDDDEMEWELLPSPATDGRGEDGEVCPLLSEASSSMSSLRLGDGRRGGGERDGGSRDGPADPPAGGALAVPPDRPPSWGECEASEEGREFLAAAAGYLRASAGEMSRRRLRLEETDAEDAEDERIQAGRRRGWARPAALVAVAAVLLHRLLSGYAPPPPMGIAGGGVPYGSWDEYLSDLRGVLLGAAGAAAYSVAASAGHAWSELRHGLGGMRADLADLLGGDPSGSVWDRVLKGGNGPDEGGPEPGRGDDGGGGGGGGDPVGRGGCPVLPPAARDGAAMPTEDVLRSTVGASLSSQNAALRSLASGLDGWGRDLYGSDSAESAGGTLPPALGLLLAGPPGTGKAHVARRVSSLLLRHCPSGSEGMLEVRGDATDDDRVLSSIVDFLRDREGNGGVVIVRRVEDLGGRSLGQIAGVLAGTASEMSRGDGGDGGTVVSASTDGVAFVLTTAVGGERIRETEDNARVRSGTVAGLIRGDLVDRLGGTIGNAREFAESLTIAPFLPLRDDDLGSILRLRLQSLSDAVPGAPWDDLHVTSAAVAAGVALSKSRPGSGGGGARALDGNALVSAAEAAGRAAASSSPPPGDGRPAAFRVDADPGGTHAVFSWCRSAEDGGAVELVCEEASRSAL